MSCNRIHVLLPRFPTGNGMANPPPKWSATACTFVSGNSNLFSQEAGEGYRAGQGRLLGLIEKVADGSQGEDGRGEKLDTTFCPSRTCRAGGWVMEASFLGHSIWSQGLFHSINTSLRAQTLHQEVQSILLLQGVFDCTLAHRIFPDGQVSQLSFDCSHGYRGTNIPCRASREVQFSVHTTLCFPSAQSTLSWPWSLVTMGVTGDSLSPLLFIFAPLMHCSVILF